MHKIKINVWRVELNKCSFKNKRNFLEAMAVTTGIGKELFTLK